MVPDDQLNDQVTTTTTDNQGEGNDGSADNQPEPTTTTTTTEPEPTTTTTTTEPANDQVLGHDTSGDALENRNTALDQAKADALENHAAHVAEQPNAETDSVQTES